MQKIGKLDFVGIGFQKCGTTSLAKYLSEDESFALPKQKELHYFCSHPKLRENQSTELSDFLKQTKKNQIKGEFTPCYITQEETLARLRNYNKSLKILVCLRNPIDRFVSAYIHAHKVGAIPRNVGPDYLIELETLHGNYGWIQNIVSQGRYANYIKTLWHYFPPKNTKIVILEELKIGTLDPNQIKKFLNPHFKKTIKNIEIEYPRENQHSQDRELINPPYFLKDLNKNTSKYLKRNYAVFEEINPQEVREHCETKLQKIYKESNKDLEKTLGLKLPW